VRKGEKERERGRERCLHGCFVHRNRDIHST
jgi:hypothetical protein